MKYEKLLHIILTVLVAVQGVSVIARFITEKGFLNVVFYTAAIMFWIVYIANMVLRRKYNGENSEENEIEVYAEEKNEE